MIFISVDLPAPLSPSSACTEPGRRRNCTLSSATTPGKDLLTPRTCSRQDGPGGTGDCALASAATPGKDLLTPRRWSRRDGPGGTGGRPPPVGAGRSGVA